MDAFLAALSPFRAQLVALGTNAFNNAIDANQSALAAIAAANTATDQVDLAVAQVALADGLAAAAAASAATALAAPGTSATSATSLTIAKGPQTLIIQTGKSLREGMTVTLARTSDPVTFRMIGVVSSYTPNTGELNVDVDTKYGAGTFSDWTISISGATGAVGPSAPIYKAADFLANANSAYFVDTYGGAITATLPATPTHGDTITFGDANDDGDNWTVNNLTILLNGHSFLTPLGDVVAEDLICDRGGLLFTLIFKSPYWKF
jgi:hypothetical protein